MRISDWSSDVCSSDLWDRQQAESSRTSGQDSDCYRFGRCATSPPPFAGAEGPETFDRKALRPAGGKIVPEPDQAALAAAGELLSRLKMRRQIGRTSLRERRVPYGMDPGARGKI